MRAIILAAGRGSRMGEMTEAIPKCLIPLAGRPLLEYQMAALRKGGAGEIVIIGGYQGDRLEGRGATVLRNPEWETTNMVATLACAGKLLEEDFILSYGDIVYRAEYVTRLLTEPSDLAVVVDRRWHDLWSIRFEDPFVDAETMVLDAGENIVELGKKITDPSRVQGQYTGLLKFAGNGRRKALALMDALKLPKGPGGEGPAPIRKMYMTDFIQGLIDGGEGVKAVTVERGWLEMDSGKDYALYAGLHARGELAAYFDPGRA